MTLIINEIHLVNGMSDSYQIIAADRRITKKINKIFRIETPKKKLFIIPHLKATVSYFGLASFHRNNKEIYFSDLIPKLIIQSTHTKNLPEFAFYLREQLNYEVPYIARKNNISGFHLSGYTEDGLPDFWHFSNITGMNGLYYNGTVENYGEPTRDFLDRDAKNHFGWDGSNPLSAKNGAWVYRNGDVRPHVIASEALDNVMGSIFQLPEFTPLRNIQDYANYVKFKFEHISYIYEKWAHKKIISRPIDIIIITKDNLYIQKRNKWVAYK